MTHCMSKHNLNNEGHEEFCPVVTWTDYIRILCSSEQFISISIFLTCLILAVFSSPLLPESQYSSITDIAMDRNPLKICVLVM